MSVDVSEKNLEWMIECALLAGGPDACPGYHAVHETPAEYLPGGYRRRAPEHYDAALCLDPEMAVAFVQATQAKEWDRLRQQHGVDARDRFLKRLASEVGTRGTLEVLRKGIKTDGCTFRLAYFRPSSGLNEALQTLYQANLFTIVRQLRYSDKHGKSLDLVLFLNGLPLFTAELKHQFIGQTVQDAMRQYRFDRQQTLGVVENIDTTSRQLQQALEEGKTIIVTTLQKFPVIAREVEALAGKRFAVIIDEAHSSQTGESTKSLKAILAAGSLEQAESEDAEEGDDLEDRIVEEMKKRGHLPNVSTFAFTATPKSKTLELFGSRREDGKYEAFSQYSMRQAIEEGFILDVLQNYTTYRAYWNLLKKIAVDSNFKFYKQIADDREFAQFFLGWLFDRYYRRAREAEDSSPA